LILLTCQGLSSERKVRENKEEATSQENINITRK